MFYFLLNQAQEVISINKLNFTITLIVSIFTILGVVWMIINAYNNKLQDKIDKKEDKSMVKKMIEDHEKLNNEQFKSIHHELKEMDATLIYIRDRVDDLHKN